LIDVNYTEEGGGDSVEMTSQAKPMKPAGLNGNTEVYDV